MKVLELCLSPGVGGLELYAVRTAVQLADRHIECAAVVAQNTMTAERMNENGIPTYSFKPSSRLVPVIAARKLAHIIDEEKVDIIHMHWGRDLNLAVLAKRFSSRPVKLIYTRQMMLTRSKHDAYHRFLYRHVDLFLTITRELRDLAQRYLPMPHSAIKTLYYGVEKPATLSNEQFLELRHSFCITDGSVAVGLIGRIEKGKGQHLLVEAIKNLKDQGVNVHGTIIGPVMDKAYFALLQNTVAEQNMSENVCFYGSHKNPVEIMSVFDVVVLTSRQETFGLVLIEAMRNGVAVIGTHAGGVSEIIDDGETGLMFEPDNSVDLARQLIRFCQDDELRKATGLAGKKKADMQFSQQQHYDKLIGLMSGLLADQPLSD